MPARPAFQLVLIEAGLGIEAIARAAYGNEVPRCIGVGFKSFAQLTDEIVNGPDRTCRLSPYEVKQLRSREYLAWVANEKHQQLEFEMGELDLGAAAHDDALRSIDDDVIERQLIIVGDRLRRSHGGYAAKHRVDPR